MDQALEVFPLPIYIAISIKHSDNKRDCSYIVKSYDDQCLKVLDRKAIHRGQDNDASRSRGSRLYIGC